MSLVALFWLFLITIMPMSAPSIAVALPNAEKAGVSAKREITVTLDETMTKGTISVMTGTVASTHTFAPASLEEEITRAKESFDEDASEFDVYIVIEGEREISQEVIDNLFWTIEAAKNAGFTKVFLVLDGNDGKTVFGLSEIDTLRNKTENE